VTFFKTTFLPYYDDDDDDDDDFSIKDKIMYPFRGVKLMVTVGHISIMAALLKGQ